MVEKVLFCDINKKAYVPEECLYTASRVGREIGFENLDIVRLTTSDDVPVFERVLEGYGDKKVLVFCWLYDTFVPSQIYAIASPLFKELAQRKNVTVAVSGWQPTLAAEIMRRSGYFDYVVSGWPWMTDMSYLSSEKPGEPQIVKQNEVGYPDDVNYMDAFDRIVNLDRCIFTSGSGEPCFTYAFEKGCQNACKFCFSNGFRGEYGGNIRKSKERIQEELSFLRDSLDATRVLITDFKLRKESIKLLLDSGLTVSEQVDLCVSDLDHEFIDLLAQANLQTGFVGIETLVPAIQKDIGKYYNLKKFADNITYGASKGIMFEGGIVLGLGATMENPLTIEDIHAQVREAIEFYREQPSLRVLFYPLIPLLGTPLGDMFWGGPDTLEMTMEEYFDLMSRVIEVREIPNNLPLPPCYESMEVYEEIRRVTMASIALVRHKSSVFYYPPSNPAKKELCDSLREHMYDMMFSSYFDFADAMNKAHFALGQWK